MSSGRPPIHVNKDEVDRFRRLGTKWVEIAALVGVSISKIDTWRRETGYEDPLDHPDDGNLEQIVRDLIEVQPQGHELGVISVMGHLLAQGIKPTREQVRVVLRVIDPEASRLRATRQIVRQEYNIVNPMELWHMDGWHKLINYGIVVHGCIDGATRLPVFMWASNNNRSKTVEKLFKSAVQKYGLPCRVRGDRGVENVLVAQYMIDQRGVGRGSYLVGTSKRNVPIERTWGHLRKRCLQFYRTIFKAMIDGRKMDMSVPAHCWLLLYLFLPIINEDIDSWVKMWSFHKLSTFNKSPLQLWAMREQFNMAWPPPDHVDEELYGEQDVQDDVGAVEEEEEEERALAQHGQPHIVVPPPDCPLNVEQLQQFCHHVVPFSNATTRKGELVARFCHALDYLNQFPRL